MAKNCANVLLRSKRTGCGRKAPSPGPRRAGTQTLSPEYRDAGYRDVHRANDAPILDPSCDAREKT